MFRNLVKGYLIRVASKIVSRLHKPKSCRCRVKKDTKLVNSSISKSKAQTVRQISSSFITPTVLLCRVAANTKSTKSYHHDQRRRAGGSCYRHVNSPSGCTSTGRPHVVHSDFQSTPKISTHDCSFRRSYFRTSSQPVHLWTMS